MHTHTYIHKINFEEHEWLEPPGWTAKLDAVRPGTALYERMESVRRMRPGANAR